MRTLILTRAQLAAILFLGLTLVAFGQAAASISVTGDVAQPLTLRATDLAAMPRATATVNGTLYEGVWLSNVLKKAGVPLGSSLRGAALSSYALASATDGYQVLFSLGELDPEIADGQVLLADTANGKPLIGSDGEFRLVIAKDKVGARSIRMIAKVEVVQWRK